METKELLSRVVSDPAVCGGRPRIRGTRIEVVVILDALAEGLSPEAMVDHFPSLHVVDVLAAVAYGAELAREGVWKATPA
jgi:uncharacterized protein (DUF433 family)